MTHYMQGMMLIGPLLAPSECSRQPACTATVALAALAVDRWSEAQIPAQPARARTPLRTSRASAQRAQRPAGPCKAASSSSEAYPGVTPTADARPYGSPAARSHGTADQAIDRSAVQHRLADEGRPRQGSGRLCRRIGPTGRAAAWGHTPPPSPGSAQAPPPAATRRPPTCARAARRTR
jgi:hypothetical protein